MKQNYSERPRETWVEVLHSATGGECIVHFNENIKEESAGTDEENPQFEADHYSIKALYREGLEESVIKNRSIWIAAAKQKETENKNLTLKERVKNLEKMQDDLTIAVLGI